MRVRQAVIGGLVLLAASGGCEPDSRPVAGHLALPAPGSELPSFSFPTSDSGPPASPGRLSGRPALLALWSTTCSASELAYEAIQQVAAEYNGRVDVIILADDALTTVQEFSDSMRPVSEMAAADGDLMKTFKIESPDTDEYRVAFALPSFLVIDREGAVAARHAGVSFDSEARMNWARAALDSLLAEVDP